jgi:hypothetical protein
MALLPAASLQSLNQGLFPHSSKSRALLEQVVETSG